jgi:8-oxo-dGTP diphosphatase
VKIRNSAKALIVRDGYLLTIKHEDREGTYYTLAGGGQEHGGTFHETVKREVIEEAGAEIDPGDLVFIREYIGKHHEYAAVDFHIHQIEYMFLCTHLSDPDLSRATNLDDAQVSIEWLPLSNLGEYRLYPLEMRPALQQYFLENKKEKTYLGNIN